MAVSHFQRAVGSEDLIQAPAVWAFARHIAIRILKLVFHGMIFAVGVFQRDFITAF